MTEPPSPEATETPVGYVDLDVVRGNAERVIAYVTEHGLRWRPHVKTHKSRSVARIQLEAGASGLTVATLREAEVMSELTDDLLLAYPPVGQAKLDRLLRLPATLDLKVALDSSQALLPLASAAHDAGRRVGVLVELDVGMHRVGLQRPEQVVALALEAADTPGVAFRGLMFYPGHIRMEVSEQEGAVAEVQDLLSSTLDALRDSGLPAEIVSGGSTPTLWRSHEMSGLTEIRAGSCIYFDREGLEIGVARAEDLAYTVLTTVVSTSVPGRAVVDAGSKALAKEGRGGAGFGFVMEHPEVQVVGLSEEHGVLDLSGSNWNPLVGDRVRIVPNHVCVSVNLQDALLAKDGERHTLLALEGRGRDPWHR